jgi:hypothetical protein
METTFNTSALQSFKEQRKWTLSFENANPLEALLQIQKNIKRFMDLEPYGDAL